MKKNSARAFHHPRRLRVGVAGSWGPGGFSAVTSLNLRIARPITCGLPPEVPAFLQKNTGGLLVAGPPGSGKTTFLRTLIRYLCEKDALVSVIDERGELLAGESDGFTVGADVPCDVYTRFPKAAGRLHGTALHEPAVHRLRRAGHRRRCRRAGRRYRLGGDLPRLRPL